jgi:hypothetical protein
MELATRPGIFSPLRHHIPDHPRCLRLDGDNARRLDLAGLWVVFATCASPCWLHANPRQDLAWCRVCRPWWAQILHR